MSANAVGIGIPGFGGFVLFAMPDVHLVYNVTPPFLHYEQARAAYQRITLTSVPATKMTLRWRLPSYPRTRNPGHRASARA